MRCVALLILVVASPACVRVPPTTFDRPAPATTWSQTLAQVRTLSAQGQTGQADSLLVQYAADHSQSPEALETNYWRALMQLQAPGGSTSSAVAMLSAYVDAGKATEHGFEAEALLRAITRLDTLSRNASNLAKRADQSNVAGADPKAAVTDAKAQDEENRKLKDELAKLKDELERIKKRLAEPPKKPPTKPPR